jgi:thioesterase domain-containing protein
MEREEIVHLLESQISLYKHLNLTPVEINEGLAHFKASLKDHFNHKGTAFGGSIYAVGVLAAYSLVLAALRAHGIATDNIVIAKAEIRYLRPIAGDFDAICEFPTQYALEEFIENLREQKKVRQELVTKVFQGTDLGAELKGLFVVKI